LRWKFKAIKMFQPTKSLNFLNHRDKVKAGRRQHLRIGSENTDELLE